MNGDDMSAHSDGELMILQQGQLVHALAHGSLVVTARYLE
jgi:hypothetical protein